MKIDSKDLEIIKNLQLNSDISLKELSKKVGLSTTPCWLRIKKLQENKILKNRPYIVDRYLLDLKVTAFVFIKTKNHNIEWSNK
ncbi:MAG: winged helix-turn-helix transcriptional regulator, partial [Burkholderiaceae bacterium]